MLKNPDHSRVSSIKCILLGIYFHEIVYNKCNDNNKINIKWKSVNTAGQCKIRHGHRLKFELRTKTMHNWARIQIFLFIMWSLSLSSIKSCKYRSLNKVKDSSVQYIWQHDGWQGNSCWETTKACRISLFDENYRTAIWLMGTKGGGSHSGRKVLHLRPNLY